jgi:hypothetical protein
MKSLLVMEGLYKQRYELFGHISNQKYWASVDKTLEPDSSGEIMEWFPHPTEHLITYVLNIAAPPYFIYRYG